MRLQQDLEASRLRAEEAETLSHDLQRELDSVSYTRRGRQAEQSRLRSDLDSLRAENDRLSQDNAELVSNLQAQAARHTNDLATIASNDTELRSLEDTISGLRDQLDHYYANIGALQEEWRRLAEQRDEQRDAIALGNLFRTWLRNQSPDTTTSILNSITASAENAAPEGD